MVRRQTIYLPDDVYAQARAYGFNISQICAEALKAEVARRSHIVYGPGRAANVARRKKCQRRPTSSSSPI